MTTYINYFSAIFEKNVKKQRASNQGFIGILDLTIDEGEIVNEYFKKLSEFRKARKPVPKETLAIDPNAKPTIIPDEPVRTEFLNYMRSMLGSFKYFHKNTPKIKICPFDFLDYDLMVFIFAEEIVKELWFNISVFTVNGVSPSILWDAQSINCLFIYYYFFLII